MADTKIEWCSKVWNPIRGCSRVSAGCGDGTGGGCYAERQAHRFNFPGGPYEGLTRLTEKGPRWTGKIRLVPEALGQPLHWRKPTRVFVNSMSDLFHEDVPDEFVAAVFGVMAAAPQHTFQILTKRPERMLDWMAWADSFRGDPGWRDELLMIVARMWAYSMRFGRIADFRRWPGSEIWPLPNVWLGVSVENQETADERIPLLLRTPAAVRFLSVEPMLDEVDLAPWIPFVPGQGYRAARGILAPDFPNAKIDWVIVGGESGPGARPCDLAWVRSIVAQCKAASTPCFVKQLGRNWCDIPSKTIGYRGTVPPGSPEGFYLRTSDQKGGNMAGWPRDLRIREYPHV